MTARTIDLLMGGVAAIGVALMAASAVTSIPLLAGTACCGLAAALLVTRDARLRAEEERD